MTVQQRMGRPGHPASGTGKSRQRMHGAWPQHVGGRIDSVQEAQTATHAQKNQPPSHPPRGHAVGFSTGVYLSYQLLISACSMQFATMVKPVMDSMMKRMG